MSFFSKSPPNPVVTVNLLVRVLAFVLHHLGRFFKLEMVEKSKGPEMTTSEEVTDDEVLELVQTVIQWFLVLEQVLIESLH